MAADGLADGLAEVTFPPEYLAAATTADQQLDRLRAGELGEKTEVLIDFTAHDGASTQMRLYYRGELITLSKLVPILHNFGFEVIDERPYVLTSSHTMPLHLSVIGMRTQVGAALAEGDTEQRAVEAFQRVWSGDAEDDVFNRLLLAARLNWREVQVVRAYYRYLRQVGARFEASYVADVLAGHPEITTNLVGLFHARLDPFGGDTTVEAALHQSLTEQLSAVESLEHDYILRTAMAAIEATVRTNYYQPGRPALSFKFDPHRFPNLPLPRPLHEIFVYSPRVEGVHLRAGDVARGGIRWSDRLDDYRTEILQLMKAQVAKNAIIVPTGAKGGFVCRRLPAGDRATVNAEVVSCYEVFIGALLDVTDNLIGGELVEPADTRCADSPDPYLVVAADKGTARFSDNANALSTGRGFWLGDAFASGGSAGYDHKAMGITAKGAWRSIRRHFIDAGIDLTKPFTVVGIGDMSGDVFGNGMLEEPNIKLIAAFDHRHIFIDPDPDPAVSYTERQRMFGLPASSWADYDASKLSSGGAVYPRTQKSIDLPAPAKAALGLAIDQGPLTPTQLLSAILMAPVDLLFNGGIGTFVKASSESHAQVGDKTNDVVRVDASQLRARVIGEGGNLGLTARARIEYSRRGGRVFADAVDNSAGVNTSDHEVNLKILLGAVGLEGDDRNRLLETMQDEVAAHVLATNERVALAITNAAADAVPMLLVHNEQMRWLEDVAHLDRRVEVLPDDTEIEHRRLSGEGLCAPEIAAMMAYTTNALTARLRTDDLLSDAHFEEELVSYFPSALRERYRPQILQHPLRRELAAMLAANSLVQRGGVSMAYRLMDETGVTAADLARAHAAAVKLFDLDAAWEATHHEFAAEASTRTRLRIDTRRLVERSTRWLLRNRRLPIEVNAVVASLQEPLTILRAGWLDWVSGEVRRSIDAAIAALEAKGVSREGARRAAVDQSFAAALDIVDLAGLAAVDVPAAARVYFEVSELFDLHVVERSIDALPRFDRWQQLSRLALREDEHRAHVELAALALRSPATFAVDWCGAHARAINRWRYTTSALVEGAASTEQLSVAVRELRTLQQQLSRG